MEGSKKHSVTRKRSSGVKGKGFGRGRRVKFEEAFPIQEVHRDSDTRITHMNVPAGWAVFDCGTQRGVCLVLNLQRCLHRPVSRKVVRQGTIEKSRPLKKKTFEASENVITSFIKLHVPGALGGQDVHYVPSVTDGSTPPPEGHDHLFPWGSSIHLYPDDCWPEISARPLQRD